MRKPNSIYLASYFSIAAAIASPNVMAVGDGLFFGVDESLVPAKQHAFKANSMDFTYHACTRIIDPVTDPNAPNQQRVLRERGYFWVSSYQDIDSVVDSQINYFEANGYHIYARYQYEAVQVGGGVTPLGNRRGYEVTSGSIALYLDPKKDTMIGMPNCQLAFNNTDDDHRIGGSLVALGEKSEKDQLANGDFEVVYGQWTWGIPDPIVPPAGFNFLHFNGNLTQLIPLNVDVSHYSEGSGNLFWNE